MLTWMGIKKRRNAKAAGKGSSGRVAAQTTSASSLVLELLAAETRQRARPAPPQAAGTHPQSRNGQSAAEPLPVHPPREMTHEKRVSRP